MISYFIMILATLTAGLVQGTTGFGAGIVAMSMLPYFFTLIQSAALSNCMGIALSGMMLYKYRKHANVKLALPPTIFFLMGSYLAIFVVDKIEIHGLKMGFGIFLIVLAIFFTFFSSRISIRATLGAMIVCGFISGVCDGLFSIGGPLMVLYFLATTKDKKEYLGTIQLLFFTSAVLNFIARIFRGLYTMELVPYTLVGLCCVYLGLSVGSKIVDKVNDQLLRKIIYGLIAISGIMTLITA